MDTFTSSGPEGHILLGGVCRSLLHMQCQYGARYATDTARWAPNTPDVTGSQYGDGRVLRVTGTTSFYHGMTIHGDDVEEFVRRVVHHLHATGQITDGARDEMLSDMATILAR